MSLRSGPGWMRTAVAAMVAASPLSAQDAPTNSAAPPPSANTVGPRELRDFNLPGRVTQPAAPPVQSPAPAPVTTAPSRDTAPARPTERPAAEPSRERPAPEPSREATAADPTRRAEPSGIERPSFPVTAAPVAAAPAESMPAPGSESASTSPAAQSAGPGWWPWLVALAAALAAAGWWWSRRRPSLVAAAPPVEARVPTPAPAPTPAPPPVAPRPPSALDGGIVSRRLQPRIQFDFTPLRIDVDAEGNAGLIYDLVIVNAGSAPAREVLVEAQMFNAGPNQDREIAAFFNAPQALGDRVPLIAPQQRLPVRSRVLLYADRFAPLEVEGRKLLVPMVAFNALYRGPNGDVRTSASFLVGRVPQGGGDNGKMAPFRVDAGARQWSDLGVRPHSAGAG